MNSAKLVLEKINEISDTIANDLNHARNQRIVDGRKSDTGAYEFFDEDISIIETHLFNLCTDLCKSCIMKETTNA